MSLINRETGETAFEDKQLNAVNKQLIEQIEKLKRDNASKNMLIAQLKKESAEAVEEREEAEKKREAVEQELVKQKKQAKEYEEKYYKELWKPAEKVYIWRCQECTQQALDERKRELALSRHGCWLEPCLVSRPGQDSGAPPEAPRLLHQLDHVLQVMGIYFIAALKNRLLNINVQTLISAIFNANNKGKISHFHFFENG